MIVNKPKKKKKISRYTVLNIIMLALFTMIMAKLLYIQVYKHEDYKEKADISSTRFISEKAPRGKIYDSEGNVLATNIQTYTLTYTKPNDEKENFYETMDKVFKILSENGEKFQDDLMLKIDSSGKFYFDFKTDDADTKKIVEVRFKRDRGLNEAIEKKLFKDKESDYTDEEIAKVDSELLKLSPEETFYELVKVYNMQELTNPSPVKEDGESDKAYEARVEAYDNKMEAYDDMSGKEILDELLATYSINDIRNYIVIKDAVKMQSFKGYRAVTIASNIKQETAFIIYQKLNDLAGIDVSIEPVRYYPYSNLASGALGYLSSIDSSKETNYELRGYDASSDLIGVAGIEAAFEGQLKGTKGGTTVKVNSKGRVTEELFKLDSYPGNNVHLTINKDVQYAAEQAMKDTLERIRTQEGQPNATRGAVVAIEVNTGRVIAMVSYPDYDPNIFSIPGRLTEDLSKQYFSPDIDSFAKEYIQRTGATGNIDELFPIDENTGKRTDDIDAYPKSFFNYATQGLLPPGSTFKPLTVIAGLMDGVVSPTESMDDYGGVWTKDDLKGFTLQNFQGSANGPTDARKALEVSSNLYFYELGYRLWKNNGADIEALDSLAKYGYKFGLGIDPLSPQAKNPKTGIEIEENFGQIYNFNYRKESIVNAPLYELVEALAVGKYYDYTFIPLNISKNDDDTDELKAAKEDLKSKISDTLSKVGTDEEISDNTKFAESIVDNVKKIMDLSPQYQNEIKSRKSSGGNIDVNDQAAVIADAIAYYTINNAAIQITTPGQIISSAIGQGMNLFTPIQMANYVATLGSGGTRYKVTMVDKITSPTGEIIKEFKPEIVDQLDIPDEYLQTVKDGMYRVNNNPANGVAYQSFSNFPIKVGGKTGTADFNTDERYKEIGRKPYGNYISMAPLDNPQIAIFSTIYDGNKGSSGASIHKAIYEAFFKEELLKLDPSYASKSESFRKYVLESPLKDNKNDSIKLDNSSTNTTNNSTSTNNQ